MVENKYEYEYFLMKLLQIPSIQETLEHVFITQLYISICTSVIDLLVEFKRIKTVRINLLYNDVDEIEEFKQKILKFMKELRKKHSEIQIDNYIGCLLR